MRAAKRISRRARSSSAGCGFPPVVQALDLVARVLAGRLVDVEVVHELAQASDECVERPVAAAVVGCDLPR
jgi:hypothetical protein